MLSLTEWARANRVAEKSWLVLGKGPTFAKLQPSHFAQYSTFALNHVIREVSATVAHAIDIDVIHDCSDAIERNARFLLMPYRPHVDCLPTQKTLDAFIQENATLKRLSDEGRLVWYNSSTSKEPPKAGAPIINVKFFSAEAAINILATSGAKVIRSLGVDGGDQYSNAFDDLTEQTRLRNGHTNFDSQFAGIAQTILKTGVFYAPLTMPAPVRVFVGTDSAQMAGLRALEYSIKKRASISTEVVAIDDRDTPVPVNPQNRSRTGFSFARFRIPELCGFRGRGIYLDADMQVFADIKQLWTIPFDDADVLYSEQTKNGTRAPQYSVMVLNCDNLKWDVREIVRGLDEDAYSYQDLMYHFCLVPPSKRSAKLPFEWNSLEHYEAGQTKLIHYTDMPTQPWVTNRNPFASVWYANLREALSDGFISPDFIYTEVERGHVSPDLPAWVGLPGPRNYDSLMQNWTPPYRRFSQRQNGPTPPKAVPEARPRLLQSIVGALRNRVRR